MFTYLAGGVLFVVNWAMLAVAAAYIAEHKNSGRALWGVLALILYPVLSYSIIQSVGTLRYFLYSHLFFILYAFACHYMAIVKKRNKTLWAVLGFLFGYIAFGALMLLKEGNVAQPVEPPEEAPANAPGRKLLKVTSIIMIVLGGIAVVAVVPRFIAALGTGYAETIFLATFSLIACTTSLAFGGFGLRLCGNPAKANYFLVTGAVMGVIAVVAIMIAIAYRSFGLFNLVDLALPVLYVVGGYMNHD